MNQNFRFNNPTQFSNWIILVSFCSSHSFYEHCSFFKFKKSIFPQNLKKSLCITTKTCTQIENFKRNFLENYNDSELVVKTKNAPFFMHFPNINKQWQLDVSKTILSPVSYFCTR